MFPSPSCIIRGQYHVLVLAKHWITVFLLRCNNNILRTKTNISPSRGHSLVNVFLIKHLHTSGHWKLLSRLKKWFLAYSYPEFHLKKHVIVGIKEEKLNLWKRFIASLNNSRLLNPWFKRHDSKCLFPILLSISLFIAIKTLVILFDVELKRQWFRGFKGRKRRKTNNYPLAYILIISLQLYLKLLTGQFQFWKTGNISCQIQGQVGENKTCSMDCG